MGRHSRGAMPFAPTTRLLADSLIAAIFAPACVSCARVLDTPTGSPACEACWRNLGRYTPPWCDRCGAPLARAGANHACLPAGAALTALRTLGPYEGVLRDLVHALKFDRRRSLARRLGALLCSNAVDIFDGADALVPVPLHPWRQWRRGFNQVDDLARALRTAHRAAALLAPTALVALDAPVAHAAPVTPAAPFAPVAPVAPVAPIAPSAPVAPVAPSAPAAPVAPVGPAAPDAPIASAALVALVASVACDLPVWHALRRRRATKPQSELDADARQANVRDAFRLSGWTGWRRAGWAAKVSGRTLVLVDDVTTTGATLDACGEVLRRHGAREIRAVTIGRVVLDTK